MRQSSAAGLDAELSALRRATASRVESLETQVGEKGGDLPTSA